MNFESSIKSETFHRWINNAALFDGDYNKTVLFPAQATMAARSFAHGEINERERHFEAVSHAVTETESIGFYFASDVRLRGSGFVFKNGGLFDRPDLIPKYVRDQIINEMRWDFSYETLKTDSFDDPTLLIASDAHKIYGHWLLDILPRAWLYKNFFGTPVPRTKLLLPSDTPDFAKTILRDFFDFTSDDIIMYQFPENDAVLKRAILPSLLHVDHQFHPAMNLYVAQMIETAARLAPPGAAERGAAALYVSRQRFQSRSESYARLIDNESAVIDLVTRKGFTVIHPEEMGWASQIAAFSQADMIVGESGSGLHNAIFARAGSTVVCLNPGNYVQGAIAGLRDQRIAYLCGEPADGDHQAIVALDRLEAAIDGARALPAAG